MSPITQPQHGSELARPTARQINLATVLAGGIAAFILITTILPNEYGIDPTGIGKVLGLTQRGAMKRDQASAARISGSEDIVIDEGAVAKPWLTALPAGGRSAELRLTLQPDEGVELKATMTARRQLGYIWSTDGAAVNFDLHGERLGAPKGEYTSYKQGTSTGMSGMFTAPFTGTHGWFFRNRSGADVAITVRIEGDYERFVQRKRGRTSSSFGLRSLWSRWLSR